MTMTVDEKLAVIARAPLILSAKAAHTWDYDGETMVGEGVSLDPDIEEALEQIASKPCSDSTTASGEYQ